MAKAQKAIPSHGAKNAFKGIQQGTTFDLNGCKAGMNKSPQGIPAEDKTVTSKTISGSSSLNQHKKLAMTGHT